MRRATSLSLLVAGILLASSDGALHAAVVEWNNPAGGTFSDGANWQGGKAPGPDDTPFFGSDSPAIQFDSDVTTNGLTVRNSDVHLDLEGHYFTATFGDDPNWVVIGEYPVDDGSLTVTNGTLEADRIGLGVRSGTHGNLEVGKNGVVISEVYIHVGSQGSGKMTVVEGGKVSAPDAQVNVGASAASAIGELTVSGPESRLDPRAVVVDRGNVTLEDGASATSVILYLAPPTLSANQTASAVITGSQTTWDIGVKLLVASNTNATLDISAGAKVTTQQLDIANDYGYSNPGNGAVTVQGTGTTLTSDYNNIGWTGDGTLSISDGGEFKSRSTSLGVDASAVGKIFVSQANSKWTNTAEIKVGEAGLGELSISQGAQVIGGNVAALASQIGLFQDGNGFVTVSDAGSVWQLSSPIFVGVLGDGSLNIENGGAVSNTTSAIARFEGSTGHALVTGAGSTWTTSKNMGIGGDFAFAGGEGSLEISAGGLAKITGTTTVWETGSVHLDAGTLQATTVNLSGGSLGGIGTVIGNLNNSGEVSPGNSPGTLKVQGNFSQSIDGLLKLEIGSTAADLLQVTGNAALGGTLHLSLLGGFTPSYGTTFDLLTASKLSGAFDTLELPDLGPGRSWQFNYGADRFTVTAVPEPSTIVLGVIGGMVCLAVAMRRRTKASP
jgi:T5SS/PEP-CTERM-associated repeat protein